MDVQDGRAALVSNSVAHMTPPNKLHLFHIILSTHCAHPCADGAKEEEKKNQPSGDR